MISGEVLKYLKGEHVVIYQNTDRPRNRQVCLTTPLIKSSGSVQLEIGAWAEAALPNKITDEWIYKANTKAPRSETRGRGIEGPSPRSCGLAVAIGRSNPAVDPLTTVRAKPSCSNLAQATLKIGRRCVAQCPRPLASLLSFRSWTKQSFIQIAAKRCFEPILTTRDRVATLFLWTLIINFPAIRGVWRSRMERPIQSGSVPMLTHTTFGAWCKNLMRLRYATQQYGSAWWW